MNNLSNIDILKNLARLPSFQEDNSQIINYIVSIFENQNIDYRLIKNENNSQLNIIAGLNCNLDTTTQKAILLCGHIDTVTANIDKWQTNPFVLAEDNGRLYGLGVADMKSFSANVLSAISEFKKYNTPIIYALTSDEETIMEGVKAVVKELTKLNIQPSYAIIGEPTSSMPYNCNKGFYETEIKVKGKACHSSNPNGGINSIVAMSQIVNRLNSVSKKLPKTTTLNIGTISGGTLCNVVPENCVIRFEIRTFNKSMLSRIYKSLDQIIEKLKIEYKGIEIEYNLVFEIPPFVKIADKKLNKVYSKLGGTPNTYMASTEAGFYQDMGAKVVIFGVGDIQNVHKEDEYINIEEFNSYNQKLFEIIKILEN